MLQVLSFISKRGREIGGATAQLADLAATQEVALRRLIADVDVGAESDCGTADLTALLRAAGGEAVAVSAPADPVEFQIEEQLPRHRLDPDQRVPPPKEQGNA